VSVTEVFKDEVLDDPMYVNNVISSDGKTTAIIATVAKGSPESRRKLVKETREIIMTVGKEKKDDSSQSLLKDGMGDAERPPKDFFLAGPSIVNAELDRMSQKDIKVFTPVMFAVALVILVILFRNISGVLIPAITISINIIWAVGLFVFLTIRLIWFQGCLYLLSS
jgi:predicted RND superfamily exporter protein